MAAARSAMAATCTSSPGQGHVRRPRRHGLRGQAATAGQERRRRCNSRWSSRSAMDGGPTRQQPWTEMPETLAWEGGALIFVGRRHGSCSFPTPWKVKDQEEKKMKIIKKMN